jgi:xyloglucan-specific exo-beta-1,4-glucanase
MKKISFVSICIFCFVLYTNAQVNWKNVSTQGMGYVDGLFIHPTTNTKYVRTDVGGIFRFENGTQKWVNIFDDITNISNLGINNVEAFAFDKNTSGTNQVMYALSGNGRKSYLAKTTNDGISWSINQGWDANIVVSGNAEWRCSGEKLAVDPNNSNVVYCGTRKNGLYKTTDAGNQWNKVNSFTPIGGSGGFSADNAGGISFVIFDAATTINNGGQNVTKNIYVGLIDDGVYRTNDGGTSWAYIDNGFDTVTFNPARATFNNNRLIVAVMKDSSKFNGEIWEFVPNANNVAGVWTNKTPGLQNNFGCPFYSRYPFNAVAVKPGSPNTVYAAVRGTVPRKIFFTNNFDAAIPTWKILTTESNAGYQGSCAVNYQKSNFTYPDSWINTDGYDWIGDMGFDVTNNNKLWLTSGNGVMSIEDVTANPANISSVNSMKGLEMLCVNATVSPPAPNTIPLITASMDVFGIRYTNLDNGGAVKFDNSFGTAASTSIDYSFKNPNTLVAIGQDYLNSANTKKVLKSIDGGISWQSIYTAAPTCTDAPWGGNIAISATNPNNIIWVPNYKTKRFNNNCGTQVSLNAPKFTIDGGTTWNVCNNINFANGSFPMDLDEPNAYSIGKSLESDKVNGSKFYYYAITNKINYPTSLWRTTDGGITWTQMSLNQLPVTGGGQLKANPYTEDDIWFSPFNKFIRETSFNPVSRSLKHSTDGGATWNTITSMDEVYAFGFGMKATGSNNATLIVYGKKNSVESMYTSTDLGVSFTNIGTQNIPEGIITNIEGDMKIKDRIYASTGCRGVWYADGSSIVLPLRLTSFNGYRNDNTNNLIWKVENQNDILNFIVEYSNDGISFLELIQLPFALNSNYKHETNNAITYYRIKMISSNGSSKLSTIIKIENKNTKSSYVYPNPVTNVLTIHTNDNKLVGTLAKLYAIHGGLIQTYRIVNNNTTIDLSKYAGGLYNLRLANGENLKVVKN